MKKIYLIRKVCNYMYSTLPSKCYEYTSFAFDETQPPGDNSFVQCRIYDKCFYELHSQDYQWVECHYTYLMDTDKNNCLQNIDCPTAQFDFKFTTNESDIDIFLPHIEAITNFMFFNENNDDYAQLNINQKLKTIFSQNLEKTKLKKKKTINVQNARADLVSIKKDYADCLQRRFIRPHDVNKHTFNAWSGRIAQTLANTIIEYHFMERLKHYDTVEQLIKPVPVFKK